MSNVKYMIIYGKLDVDRKEKSNFQKGDAIWDNNAKVKILSRYNNLEEARNQLDKVKCEYYDLGIRGMSAEEYAIIAYKTDKNGVYFMKDSCELAKEELRDGGQIIVCEKYILNGIYKTREEINIAIRNQEHEKDDFFNDWCDWKQWVEWRDGKTIILEEFSLN